MCQENLAIRRLVVVLKITTDLEYPHTHHWQLMSGKLWWRASHPSASSSPLRCRLWRVLLTGSASRPRPHLRSNPLECCSAANCSAACTENSFGKHAAMPACNAGSCLVLLTNMCLVCTMSVCAPYEYSGLRNCHCLLIDAVCMARCCNSCLGGCPSQQWWHDVHSSVLCLQNKIDVPHI